MLFNSYAFVLVFLPVILLVYHWLSVSTDHAPLRWWLVAASLFFYGWWNVNYLPVVLCSIIFNFLVGIPLRHPTASSGKWLAFGITGNLLLLSYYKYAGFLTKNISALTGVSVQMDSIVLPIGISFFTFTQIAYLADLRHGRTRDRGLPDYLLFVTFFPHLIAGPIVHHRELVCQFDRLRSFASTNLAIGIGLFSLGLLKKVVIADSLAPYAVAVFDGQTPIGALGQADAWYGAFAYTFQLYFDFSGYADMAVGISRMFGIALPCNFDSPYKSTSIIDFWRRWHMTLSRFLRDYLYIPIGGNRRGPVRRYANLFTVMLLAGLWHGAGWKFVVWGAIHGVLIMINHLWLKLSDIFSWEGFRSHCIWRTISWGITFICVVSAWVVFRSDSIKSAFIMLSVMYGLPPAESYISVAKWLFLVAIMICLLLLPNSQKMFGVSSEGLLDDSPALPWVMGLRGAVLAAGCVFVAILLMGRPSPFLYFQF